MSESARISLMGISLKTSILVWASTATESCAATCGGAFPSIIKFEWYPVDDPAYDGTTKQHHQCGLSDNAGKIGFLLGVARSLCARLSFPHPWQALLNEHNYGRPLDKSWRWGRYLSNSTVELMVGPGEAHAADGAQLLETNGYRDKGNTLTETVYYLRKDLSIKCYESDEHARAVNIAIVLMVAWPIVCRSWARTPTSSKQITVIC